MNYHEVRRYYQQRLITLITQEPNKEETTPIVLCVSLLHSSPQLKRVPILFSHKAAGYAAHIR